MASPSIVIVVVPMLFSVRINVSVARLHRLHCWHRCGAKRRGCKHQRHRKHAVRPNLHAAALISCMSKRPVPNSRYKRVTSCSKPSTCSTGRWHSYPLGFPDFAFRHASALVTQTSIIVDQILAARRQTGRPTSKVYTHGPPLPLSHSTKFCVRVLAASRLPSR